MTDGLNGVASQRQRWLNAASTGAIGNFNAERMGRQAVQRPQSGSSGFDVGSLGPMLSGIGDVVRGFRGNQGEAKPTQEAPYPGSGIFENYLNGMDWNSAFKFKP